MTISYSRSISITFDISNPKIKPNEMKRISFSYTNTNNLIENKRNNIIHKFNPNYIKLNRSRIIYLCQQSIYHYLCHPFWCEDLQNPKQFNPRITKSNLITLIVRRSRTYPNIQSRKIKQETLVHTFKYWERKFTTTK